MDRSRHCELCDHQEISLTDGSTCKLINSKPDFIKMCSKIELNRKFEEKLKQVNIYFQYHNKKKSITYIYFVVMLLVGFLVIIGGYILGKYAIDSGVISTVPIVVMGVGVAPLALAFGTLNKYRQHLSVLKEKKIRVDKVLELYNIKYDLVINFGKSYHGTQEVYTDLKLIK